MVTKVKEGQCPKCGSDESLELDRYTIVDPSTKVLVMNQCKVCGTVFTEYYDQGNNYLDTFYQTED